MNFTLRTKIYLSMLAMILVSFVVTFVVSIYDHREHDIEYNEALLHKKEEAIRASMEYFLNQKGGEINPDSIVMTFSDKICELGDVHDAFIALFDLRGKFLISSNFMQMDSLNIPEQVNYSILKQLSTGNQRAVIDKDFQHDKYTLAYWYFNETGGKPLVITNVVYEKNYDRQGELVTFLKEISRSYAVLFLLAAAVAYLLSRYITKSLQTITRRIRDVQLGRHNELIEWHSKDEIGALVNEYNRMLGELENSAEKLARTERESAWREMAQQVAHEIKNPLTPMKLRMQQLERSWKDGENMDERIRNFSQSMIEQIDALTRIANEFSSFAKMPRPTLEPVNILSLTKSVVELYREDDRAEITLRSTGKPVNDLMLDKDQTIRVLNNLITNALQAVIPGRQGLIDICIRACRNGVLIRVNDNGPGIPESLRPKIFVPNFTTKSTGTGLGLAMVRNIVNQSRGQVKFWSREGAGASFYVYFPY